MKAYNLNQLQDYHTKIWVKLIHTPINSSEFEPLRKRYLNIGNIIQDHCKRGLKVNWLTKLLKWFKRL